LQDILKLPGGIAPAASRQATQGPHKHGGKEKKKDKNKEFDNYEAIAYFYRRTVQSTWEVPLEITISFGNIWF